MRKIESPMTCPSLESHLKLSLTKTNRKGKICRNKLWAHAQTIDPQHREYAGK